MEAQPVTPGAALFSQEQLAALQRLRTAFEQKLLDKDEYKAEKAKVLNATPAVPPPPADDDDDGFELVGVQTPAERAAESRRRAEAEGNVLEIDDDDDEFAEAPTIARGCDEFAAAPTIARAPAPPAGRFRAPERRRRVGPPAPRRIPRGEERVMLRCRRVYFGTALRRDVTVVFAPSCVTMEWRSDTSGLYIETRLAPSHMTSFDLYHGPARGAGGDGEANPINLADDDEMAPDAIREFFAIGLRQKPPHLRSEEGFEPTDDVGPRKYVVVVLDGEALATFKREAVPAVVWGGHVGWPAAPVLGTAAAARPFLEGVPIADALATADAAEDAAALRRTPSRASRRGRGRAARSVVDVEAEDPDAALPAFVYPRPDAPDAITLVRGDRGRLDDGEFLNDNLINLYLRHRTSSAEAPPLDAHVFSTFFFTKLSEAPRHASAEAYEKVKSWCRGVDLFAKDALFVPVNEHLHWSLAVVLRPGAAAPPSAVVDLAASSDDEAAAAAEPPTPAGPCVLVMDSLRSHDAARIAAYVRSFLRAAWADRPGAPGCDGRFEEASMPVVLPDLPRQRNSFDCGVYVLKFFDLLYGRPPPVRAGGRDTTFSGQFAKNLFTRADVLAERKRLAAFFDTRAAAAAAATLRAPPPAGNRDVAADLAAAMPEARARQRRDVARSAPSPAPAAAVDLTAGADFVVPPVRQSYTRRAPGDG